jgi:hypothetical protein
MLPPTHRTVVASMPAALAKAGNKALTARPAGSAQTAASSESLPGLLATNKVPCVTQFTVGEALLRSQYGPAKLVRFTYSDAGLSYYANGIVATAATIASKPDVVRRFVAATEWSCSISWICCCGAAAYRSGKRPPRERRPASRRCRRAGSGARTSLAQAPP